MLKSKIIFIGTEHNKGQGGVAAVLLEYSKIFPEAIFVPSTSSNGKFKNFYYLMLCFLKLSYYLLKYPNSIVHIHGSSYTSFKRKYIIFKFCKKFRTKIIYHIHGGEFHIFHQKASLQLKHKITSFINNADCIICLSLQWKNYFLANFSPKKIEIIPNIVAAPQLTRKMDTSTKYNFLFLGKICEQKGVWLLLDAIEALKEELQDKFIFTIGGNGEVGKLHSLIVNKNLNNLVQYVGWVSSSTKSKYLSAADAFILPSYNEGLPISILEAMTYGLPIIATNVGGIPEIIKHNVNGLLIAPRNTTELVNALQYVINNQASFKTLGAQNTKLVANHLPLNVKNNLLTLYQKL